MMTTLELRTTLSEITNHNIQQATSWMSKLSEKQLNWRPNPGIWSIAEVLAHLNSYARYYHPAVQKKIETTRFKNVKEDFMSSPLGRSAWKSMKLGRLNNVKRKFKAPKGHNPSIDPDLVQGNELPNFLEQQQELLSIIDASMDVNVRKVKVPISISKIVRLRLGDALLFITYHNERHMQQILNLKKHKNFPNK
ncbi:MAG: DinB family protein [Crocinitomicaceae bacterium]|nr:DinB family protein [Crocinitomicaceae bacterium]